MAGLNVLVLPTWYATPVHPIAGVFVRDQALAVARRERVVVLYNEGSSWRVRRLFALHDGVEGGLRTLRLRHRPSALPRASTLLAVVGLDAAMDRLRREGFAPDVIHAHTLGAAAAALVLGRAHGVPVVVSEHWSAFALGTLSPWERRLARFVFEHVELVCPVSERLREAIAAHAPRARLRVIGNPVDTTLFVASAPERASGPGPVRLLAVGLLAEKKGMSLLLEALARRSAAGGRPVVLDLVGDGPAAAELGRHACALELEDTVRFRGLMERAEIAQLMGEADLFVLPSLVETFGIALVEALAAGLPVVATDVGVAREIVDDGCGVLVAPNDVDALAAGIDLALTRLGSYELSGVAETIRTRFSPEAVAQQWAETYRMVLA
ncbi:MAG: glycosyltransferase [Actinomycetota bacterium]|nr:glycosyltransferase [Actinomycetota bacterium]